MICLWIGKEDIKNRIKRKEELEINQSKQYEEREIWTKINKNKEKENLRRKMESIYIL